MSHHSARSLRTLALLSALMLATGAHASEVVTSIKPLQLITAALTEGVTRPEVLLPAEGSPHHYALKPSRHAQTDRGESDRLDRPRAGTVYGAAPEPNRCGDRNLAPRSQAAAAPGSRASELDSGDDAHHDEPQQDAENPAAEDHGEAPHEHGAGNDPHIWLDPMQGLDIAQRVLPALQRAFPQHRQLLQQNYAAFATALRQRERAIAAQLAPYRDAGFFVFHDAYSGFVDHYA